MPSERMILIAVFLAIISAFFDGRRKQRIAKEKAEAKRKKAEAQKKRLRQYGGYYGYNDALNGLNMMISRGNEDEEND